MDGGRGGKVEGEKEKGGFEWLKGKKGGQSVRTTKKGQKKVGGERRSTKDQIAWELEAVTVRWAQMSNRRKTGGQTNDLKVPRYCFSFLFVFWRGEWKSDGNCPWVWQISKRKVRGLPPATNRKLKTGCQRLGDISSVATLKCFTVNAQQVRLTWN